MTIHSFYTHNCIKCNAYYIPYEDNLPCPKCGNKVKMAIDFIELAVESTLFNLRTGNSYMPGGWMMDSLGDRILLTLFQLFHEFSENKDNIDFKTYSQNEFSQVDWGEQQYLAGHICEISILVYDRIQESNKAIV